MSGPTPIADLSPATIALLRDEATLSVALNVLEDSRRDNLTRTEEIQKRKPTLGGLLSSKKDREEYAAALKNVQTQLASIDTLISRATIARNRVQPLIQSALTQHLSETDPALRQGFRASRFYERWPRFHAIVADRLQGFLRDLREASAALNEDARTARARHSSSTTWKLTTLQTAAAELERALNDLNATAAEHAAAVAGTPFAASQLPATDSWNCINRVDTISLRPIPEAAASAVHLLTEFTEVRKHSLGTLAALFNAATVEHTDLTAATLRARWSELLAYAETHLVSDAELEPALADIERRLLESERIRLNAELDNQAFRHEP